MIKLSVIICSYNRQEYILKALTSLVNQTLESSLYEIIIVNNNSTDNTDNLCKEFVKQYKDKYKIKYFIEPSPGLSNARNKGFSVAEGNIITYMDDDAIAREDFVANIIKSFNNNPAYDAIGGKVLPVFPNGQEPKWLSKYLNGMVTKVDYGDKQADFKHKYPAGCNMSFKREIFNELGGFNTNLTIRSDDKYMFLKLRANKKKILYSPDVLVHHHIDAYRLTRDYLKNQSHQIGYGERMRLMNESFFLKAIKFFEYCFKCTASIILGIMFLARGKYQKALYLNFILFHTFFGYLFIKPKY